MSILHAYTQTVADGTATSIVRPSDWNSAHNQFITLSGNTAGQSTVSGTNIVFQGGDNVTLSANTAAGAATIVFSGLGHETHNYWMPYPSGNNSSFLAMGQNTVYMQGLDPPGPVAVSNVEFMMLYSYVSSSNSQQAAMTINYGLYEYGTGASTASITQVATSSMSIRASYNSSTTGGFTIGNSVSSFTTGTNGGSAMFASLSGPTFLYLPFTTTLDPSKEYFWAMNFSSATTGNTGPLRLNMYIQTIMNSTNWGELKVNTAIGSGTNNWEEFDGMYYSATSAGLPTAVHSTQMRPMVSRGRLFMIFENE